MTKQRPSAGRAAATPLPTVKYAWYVVIILMLVQVISYLDRFLPSLLIGPIKADLHLTDFQIGLLLGPAFALFYIIVALPIGWMADRYNRRTILATSITLWCCMTALASMARSFVPLFATRLGVGLGEAAVAPCSISIISDYFTRERRARAISIFMSGTFIGAGVAFLLGGPLVHLIATLPPVMVPYVGEMRPWQMTFLLVGLPGLFLAGMMFTIREPLRRERVADTGANPTFWTAFAYIRQRWQAFGTLFLASACCVTLGSLTFWNVALFDRTWGWNVRDVGIVTGLMYLTGGPVGTALVIWLTNRRIAAGRPDASLSTLWVGLLIAVPGFAAYPMMPSAPFAVAALFVAFVGQAIATAAGPASFALIAPGQIRSQAMAIYYLVISLFGLIIGPPLVGLMTDLFGGPGQLRYAMTVEALLIGIPAIILVAIGMASYRRKVVELEQLIDASAEAVVLQG
ncbi:MFS transporter [Govanella unica]|uniref:MFS transporter n=1 Tax=Govanella unica TaxID=2975056 RepID=A0A9X3TYC8_9PROT|nr:MFS transporter [Govania unica]